MLPSDEWGILAAQFPRGRIYIVYIYSVICTPYQGDSLLNHTNAQKENRLELIYGHASSRYNVHVHVTHFRHKTHIYLLQIWITTSLSNTRVYLRCISHKRDITYSCVAWNVRGGGFVYMLIIHQILSCEPIIREWNNTHTQEHFASAHCIRLRYAKHKQTQWVHRDKMASKSFKQSVHLVQKTYTCDLGKTGELCRQCTQVTHTV